MDIDVIAKEMVLLQPLRIRDPGLCFVDCLLRCNDGIHPDEMGSDSFLVKRPGMGFSFERLPDSLGGRREIADEWRRLCSEGERLFVSVGFEPGEDAGDGLWRQFNTMRGSDFSDAAESVDGFVRDELLPSFGLFAAVWHFRQIAPDSGCYMPPHLHLLYRRVRRTTAAQDEIIRERL